MSTLLDKIATIDAGEQREIISMYISSGSYQIALDLVMKCLEIKVNDDLLGLAETVVSHFENSDALRNKIRDLKLQHAKVIPFGNPQLGYLTSDEVATQSVTLKDVIGMADIKRRLLLSFLAPMKNPALREKFKADIGGGVLLWGPPGCGKTMIGKALAGEVGAHFIHVSIADVLGSYRGDSERNLVNIFDTARSKTPSVLFFDEIDAIGRKRSETANRDLTVTLLEQMQGVASENKGVYCVAATNHPWDLDSAVRRSGRLDHSVFVPPPDKEARHGILKAALADRPTGVFDVSPIVEKTEQYSCADLVLLCKTAAEAALLDAIEDPERVIHLSDLENALKVVKPTTLEWLQHSKNYSQFGNEKQFFEPLREYLANRRLG